MNLRRLKTGLYLLVAVSILAATTSREFIRPSELLAALRAPRPVDSDEIRVVHGRPQLAGRRSIAADIDRDGDLDLIGMSSNAVIVVWINDGAGHFTRTVPAADRAGVGGTSPTLESGSDTTTLVLPPSPRWLAPPVAVYAPRPPDAHDAGATVSIDHSVLLRHLTVRPTRGPPASVITA